MTPDVTATVRSFAKRAWPHVLAAFVVFHVVANSIDVIPDLSLGLDRRSWNDPRAERELNGWADRFGVDRAAFADFIYELGHKFQSARKSITAPFRPYMKATGTRQAWAMFGAGTSISDRFGLRAKRCSDVNAPTEATCRWEVLYVHADDERTWLRNVFGHPRVRSAIFRWSWPSHRRSYDVGCKCFANVAFAELPDAVEVQCMFERLTAISPAKPDVPPPKWGSTRNVKRSEVDELRAKLEVTP